MVKHGVMSLTTGRVSTGTRQAVLLHRRNTAKDGTKMTDIYTTSSVAEMHTARLKINVWSTSTLNRSSVKKSTMITTIPTTTNLTDNILKGGAMQEESRLFPTT
jgi:hypothetical protein